MLPESSLLADNMLTREPLLPDCKKASFKTFGAKIVPLVTLVAVTRS
jgi:hypothetical protein